MSAVKEWIWIMAMVALFAALMIWLMGCADYNKQQLRSFQETAPVILDSARELGIEADAELKWGGVGSAGSLVNLDLGTDAAVWLRVRPGEISERELMTIIYVLLARDNPQTFERVMAALSRETVQTNEP